MSNEHPFQVLFETLGRLPSAHAEMVNRQAFENMSDILRVPVERSGRCILLRAPRAGHGKTHLLSRIQHQLGSTHEFVPLHASFGCRIDAASVMDDTLRRLVRQLPASGGLTVLDLVTRRLFASALQPLVSSGEVPCQDREGALTALRARPIETFDFHHPNAVTAHWARENFEVLGQRLSMELAQRCNLPVSGISFWVEALFQYASAPLESSNRVRSLLESVHVGTNTDMVRLEGLLGLLALLTRVVLIADDLEGFSTDETAALRLAAFLGSLRQSVERLDVILSLNEDVWQNAFLPRLSDGLADRLSEVVVELEPLKDAEMEALLESRVPGLGRRVLERIDVSSEGRHARGLIRAAGIAWIKASAQDSVSAPPVSVAPAAAVVAAMTTPEPEPAEIAPIVVPESIPPIEPAEQITEPGVNSEEASVFSNLPGSPADATPEWPDPVFSPTPAVEQETEPVTDFEPEISTYEVDPPPLPGDVSLESPPVNQGQEPSPPSPEADSIETPPPSSPPPTPDSSEFTAPVDSPFQEIAFQDEKASFTQNVPSSNEPVQDQTATQEPVDSPFQLAPEPNNPANTGDTWSNSPPPPPTLDFLTPPPYPAPENPPAEAPPYQQFTPEPPVQSFSPPEPTPEFPTGTLISDPQPEPVAPDQPAPEQGFSSSEAPPLESPPPSREDTDRVDDLLKQFRERYGRGSL